MKEQKTIEDLITETYAGKILVSVEFGFIADPELADVEGERYMPLPAKIEKAWLDFSEGDLMLFFQFEGHELNEEFSIYFNEMCKLEDGDYVQ